MAVSQRCAPQLYKDSLTPALHRRFTKAASIALLLCYIESVLIGDKSSLIWSWFPIGIAGIRTLLLFISALAVFVLRVAQLHIGARTTSSPLHTFGRVLFHFNLIQTLGWYLFSAWWFSEVYVWSFPKEAELSWIIQAKPYGRPHLNERPIYLRTTFYLLAVIQTCRHLYYDYDRVCLPYEASHSKTLSNGQSQVISSPGERLKSQSLRLLERTFFRTMSMPIVGPLVYHLFLRRIAWGWTASFAVKIWTLPRTSSVPPRLLPYDIGMLARSAFSSYLLALLWEVSSLSFSLYVAQEPLKRDKPLTDYSRDPNGTLLTGLKSKREIPRAFAFWELYCICQRFPERRKSFFEDIDRKGGATWTQLLNACLFVIQAMDTRLIDTLSPPGATSSAVVRAQPAQPSAIQGLPRISSTPLKQDPIFVGTPSPATRREKVQHSVGTFAKSHGQKPASSRSGRTPLDLVLWLVHICVTRLLSPEQKQSLSTSRLSATINDYGLHFLRSPLGLPFRQTLRRRCAAVILGSPTGDPGILLDAIESLTHLATSSLTEDPYGHVQRDIPLLVRTYLNTLAHLDAYTTHVHPHWSDIHARTLGINPEHDFYHANLLRTALATNLARLIAAFEPYADVLGLSPRDIRLAREATTMTTAAARGGEGADQER